ncbi:hypothetical protein [Bradyrhizobium sp. CER78]|uniref:hypothetical protein n=1 Tax=Bradyrhizobium sp. CER78 TaxID=3039162 RepID=UPI002447FDA5|nr:hypothetical protein [Bradyrhizobium sp. CER78]MDH2385516.1 hypothetical protein [Bradyrhizobium sp. CER78]
MTRPAILMSFFALLASSHGSASECVSASDIAASRTRLAATRGLPASTDDEKTCRAYAASFYELVTARQIVANCARGNNLLRDLKLLDSEIDALNNALASRCGG